MGYDVDRPNIVEGKTLADKLDEDPSLKSGFINEHVRKIDTAEAILVLNYTKNDVNGYIGGNTLMEMAHAYDQGLDIFLLNPIPEMSYSDEIRGMHPTVINGDLKLIDTYMQTLPLVMMSTKSELKHRALSRAMRQIGRPVRVDGVDAQSGVSDQPQTIDETYRGALNRHRELKESGVQADYYATVESGLHRIIDTHSAFGCNVVMVEKSGEAPRAAVELSVEFPKSMLDKVPSEYPDLGELVRAEYGSAEKDPHKLLTGGSIPRLKNIENAFYNLLVQEEGIYGR